MNQFCFPVPEGAGAPPAPAGSVAVCAAAAGRSGAAALAARQLADRFNGLPAGITRWRLAAALRVAAPRLQLTPSMLALATHYIDLSWDADWQPGAEPIIGRPVVEIAEALGRSERQIRNIEHALMQRGLLSWRDSGNQHRRAWRGPDGGLRHAYGPTLAPMGTRAAEILALAGKVRAEQARARTLRLEIGALRRRLRQDMAALPAAEGKVLAARLDALPARCPSSMPQAALNRLHEDLTALAAMVPEAVRRGAVPAPIVQPDSVQHLAGTSPATHRAIPEPAAMPAIRSRPLQPTEILNCKKVAEPRKAVSAAEAWHAAGPTLRTLCDKDAGHGAPGWPALTDAAARCAPMLGLSSADWGEACARLGRIGATLGVIVLERAMLREVDGRWPPVQRPAAWIRALADRHAQGRLALDRSIRGLLAGGRAPDRVERGRRTPVPSAMSASPYEGEQR